jgi:hypothetical protein
MHSVNKTTAILVSCLALAVALIAPVASHADEWNLKTRFEVSQPFEVPGMALQANTKYVIRLLDSPSERHIVQIYSADETKMLTMFMAVSDTRMEPTDRTEFTFIETAPGYPLPVKEWFYPGRLNGLEFIYPKHQAREIAQHAREKILSTDSTNLHDLASLKVEAVEPKNFEKTVTETAANVTKLETPAVVEEKPTAPSSTVIQEPEVKQLEVQEPASQESTSVLQDDTTTETTTTNDQQTTVDKRELPRTAGELPLIGLIGALCLVTGLGMNVLSANHK